VRVVLALAAASLCLPSCGALLDLPDDPRVARDEHDEGRRGNASPGTPLDPPPAAANPSETPESAASPSPDEAAGAVNDAGAERQAVAHDASEGGGFSASPERDAGLVGAIPDATPGGDAIGAVTSAATGDVSVEALVCPPIRRESITDFSFLPGSSGSQAEFGVGTAFSGGTFFYPDGALGLTSDVTRNDWRLSGTVRATSGFGLFFVDCKQLDASAYSGIAFTLSGRLDAPLVFFIESAAHQVSHVWLNDSKASATDPEAPPNLGRCTPSTSRYDGSCREPRTTLRVSPVPTEIRVLWRDLTGGSPEPSIDPSEITSIAWALPEPVDGPYAFDIRIDTLRLLPAATGQP
jgi:hypothetical protein